MPATDTSPSALMKAATPGLYRSNAFRLTGLMVTASAREVARQADKLKMLAEVGGHAAQQLSVLPGSQAPTIEEVREASQKLKDLEARAVDEFFWFWPEDWERPEADEAIAALKRNDLDAAFAIWVRRESKNDLFAGSAGSSPDDAGILRSQNFAKQFREMRRQKVNDTPVVPAHNLAVLFHMRALEWAGVELQEILSPADRETQVKYWREAFDRWEWLVGDDRLWDTFKNRIRLVNDAALTTGFARRLRNELPQAFDQINAQLALQFAQQERGMETEWHVEFLQSTHADDDDAEGTLGAVLVPVRQSLERHLESAQADLRRDKKHGLSHAQKLLSAALPLHHTLALIMGQDHSEVIEFGDHIAGAALACSVTGYNTTMEAAGDEAGTAKSANAEAFVSVLNDILPLATDSELSERIKTNLKTARTNHTFDSQLRPLMDRLIDICENYHSGIHISVSRPGVLRPIRAREKLLVIQEEFLPKLDVLLASKVLPTAEANEFCSEVAMIIRGVGIKVHNDDSEHYSDHLAGVVMMALNMALKYARTKQLIEKILCDQETVKLHLAMHLKSVVEKKLTAKRRRIVVCVMVVLALFAIFRTCSS